MFYLQENLQENSWPIRCPGRAIKDVAAVKSTPAEVARQAERGGLRW